MGLCWKKTCPGHLWVHDLWVRGALGSSPWRICTSQALHFCCLSAGKSKWIFGSLVILEIDFCLPLPPPFFTILKNGLTHSCRRLWGFTADHLFQLLAVINFFSYFLLLLRYLGEKICSWWHWRTSKSLIFFFLLRETIYSGCSCYERITFLLGFLNGDFCLLWTSRRTWCPVYLLSTTHSPNTCLVSVLQYIH